MTLGDALEVAIRPALAILPERFNSQAARAMLLAIGLQESRFLHRRQIRGPARGFWQFEVAGVSGVLRHKASKALASELLARLGYRSTRISAREVHACLEHNDVLAAGFARLLLWTLPAALPREANPNDGWAQYLAAWRPGKPHRATWDPFYAAAWEVA